MKNNTLTSKIINKAFAIVYSSTLMLGLAGTAQATLIDRGNGMIYDSDQNLTWLQDANYAKTSGYDADGKMHWQEANNWAAGLNFGGFDDWRLATVVDQVDGGAEVGCDYSVDGSDCGYNVDTAGSEMAYMWYNILSGTPSYDTNGVWEPDSGFTGAIGADGVEIFNLQGDTDNNGSDFYWTGTSIPRWNDCCAFTFHAGWGLQNYDDKDGSDQEYFAWAVRSGDVAAVPIPGTVWLFSSGLMGLLGYSRRKQAISA